MRAPRLLLFLFLALLPFRADAQDKSAPADSAAQQSLKPGELDALVAPIALYPDSLLAQVLMASTYPLEVVQAERWVKERKKLKEEQLKKEAQKQSWDDSVKSLVATPAVLTMMSTKLDWTQKLGDAVLAQQPDVMDAIQRLRTKAQANDKLQTTKEQKVAVRTEGGKQRIAIEPTDPDTIYVPYYDPAVVYGDWPYPEYPPYYWYEPGYITSGVIATGLAFGAACAIGHWGNRWWGGNINWDRGDININRGARVEHWQHNPRHRRGVAYNNANVRQKFAGSGARQGRKGQGDFRGRDGKQVLKPGDRAKAGDRRQGGQAKAGDRGKKSGDRAARKSGGSKKASQRSGKKQAGKAKRRPSQASRSSQQRRASQRHQSRGASRASRGGSRNFSGPRGNRAGRSYGYRSRGVQGSRGFGGRRVGGGRGGGGRGGGRGGRRSDIRLKHDIHLLGHLDNGLGFYRFSYTGSTQAYVGVMAQEVEAVEPNAVVYGKDGYMRVRYDMLGLKFQSYEQWTAAGAQVPRKRPVTAPGSDDAVPAAQ